MLNAFHTLIEPIELSQLLESGNTVVLDCRFVLTDKHAGRRAYLTNHIPGAYYLDLDHDLSSPVLKGISGRHPLPHPEVLQSTLQATGMTSESQVIVYDQSNSAYAARAWWLLNWLGHDRVAVLNGGFDAWCRAELPTDNQWPPPKKGTFRAHLQDHQLVDREYVNTHKEGLADSRALNRYSGKEEPIDPVAGHIEGAICLPYMENTQPDGTWKSPEELADRFENANLIEFENPVFYCGSGVTACHNILAFKIATGKTARLYAGSWSEWINYYPAATGP